MWSHPIESHQRIVNVVDNKLGAIAEMFERYVYKLPAPRQTTGDMALLPYGGGAETKLSEEPVMKRTNLVALTERAPL